jgi:DeoR/GlpR family transcriptional regulator of sugar metabolism
MARQARRATVLADSSKLGQSALVIACGLDEVDRLVTDSPPPDDLAEALDNANTRLYVTNAPD